VCEFSGQRQIHLDLFIQWPEAESQQLYNSVNDKWNTVLHLGIIKLIHNVHGSKKQNKEEERRETASKDKTRSTYRSIMATPLPLPPHRW